MRTPPTHVPRGMACAEEPLDEDWLDALQDRRCARLGELFTRVYGRRLAARSAGLDDVIPRSGESFRTAWSAPLGQVRDALLTTPLDEHRAAVAAASVALDLAARGQSLHFRVTLDRPELLRFGLHSIVASNDVAFESDGARARLGDVAFTRTSDGWSSSLEPDVCIRTTRTPVVLLGALPGPASLPPGLVAAREPHADLRARYEAAYSVLADHAQPYLTWVDRTVRALVPVETRASSTTSSSFELAPSVVALSHTSPAITMADALVHEASHQHFYALTQLGPVDDGSDTSLYFSPARGEDRPIDKILLAYHAFANVLLFYRCCREHGVADLGLCVALERSYEDVVATLQRPLEVSRALTPLGRALFEPLAERLGRTDGAKVGQSHPADTQREKRRRHV